MNLASSDGDREALMFVNFSQDCLSLAVGRRAGYQLYSLQSADNLELVYDFAGEDVCIVERLFASSLVALVGSAHPRKLKVCHFKKGSEICNYCYPGTILAVKLNRNRLIVVLEESLVIHNIHNMKVLHTIKDTPHNPHGLCALSCDDKGYFAYPGSESTGEVQVFDTMNLTSMSTIPAHNSPVAALAFSADGTRLATASEKGTVIRVFSMPEGVRLMEFRRGVKRCVSIYSLAFSQDGRFLCSASNTETVHIFRIEGQKKESSEDQQSWLGFFGNALSTPAKFLPNQMTEAFTQTRAFATVKLPTAGVKNICAIATIDKIPRAVVASGDGYLYIYSIHPDEGGECHLHKQHPLFPKRQEQEPAPPSAASSLSSGLAGLALHTDRTEPTDAATGWSAAQDVPPTEN